MALVTLPSNNSAVQVVAAAGKAVIQCVRGAAIMENAADPSDGISITQGEIIAIDGWTAAWNAQSGITGTASIIRVASE